MKNEPDIVSNPEKPADSAEIIAMNLDKSASILDDILKNLEGLSNLTAEQSMQKKAIEERSRLVRERME